ncbi:predicted protein [Uncinocarpus reesii 1704]|uniref:Protein kinase domain-containing protein n=1 Tax=Uncinocarpus reesii (strain UAMH 1704) TaxID=336963 RepID=C4JVK7_UNCRE|nr:uncharacterized protein UREG_06599 [Uncinocarpus reesii 1704]EEP81734.1 predicted protein [Uncinocarpus reesii 1704]
MDPSKVILFLVPRNLYTRASLIPPKNADRLVKQTFDFGKSRAICLSFLVAPNDAAKGFVFGSHSQSCDVVLSSEKISETHFSIDFSAAGVLMLKNLSEHGTVVGDYMLLKPGDTRIIEQESLIECGNFSFWAIVPQRNDCDRMAYGCNLKEYLENPIKKSTGRQATFHPTAIESRKRIRQYVEVGLLDPVHLLVTKLVDTKTGHIYAAKRGMLIADDQAALLKDLSHPNIVKFVEEFQAEDGLHYIVMEHLPHGPVDDYDVPLVGIRDILRHTLSALEYLHDRGITHGNITPSHIVINSICPSQVKLVGFSRATKKTLTRSNYGNVPFYAPELFHGRPYTPAADIWALALSMLVLRKGSPYGATEIFDHFDNIEAAKSYIRGIYKLLKRFDSSFRPLLAGMLEQNPDKRWTAQKCLEELKKISFVGE